MQLPEQIQLLLVSGKGGVGKSTTAAALAQHLAHIAPDRRVWLVSADPAHSIADVLALRVGSTATQVGDHANWSALALDAEAELRAFRAQYQEAVSQIAEHSSIFEGADLMGLWNLTWPGFDEVMAVVRVSQLLLTQQCETVVLDMAPTGHAMRLLEYPDFIERLLGVFESLHSKHQQLSQRFGGSYTPGASDEFLAEFTRLLKGLRELLVDPARTQAWVVLLAEELSIPETSRFLTFLQAAQIPVGGVVVNQVLTPNPDCPQCLTWQQRQQMRLQPLFALDQTIPRWQIPLLSEEPIGEERLRQVLAKCQPLRPSTYSQNLDLPYPPTSGAGLPDYLDLGCQLLLVAGKGGVGKTTTAAAIALTLSQRHPEKRVLIVSIDPAHSLGDSFAQPLSAQPQPITTNLWGQEVEPETTLAGVIASLRAVLDGLNRDNLSIEEVQTWQYLLDQPPPGLDEMAALLNVINSGSTWDLIVLDTAPTGHLLRFLHLPEALEAWLTYLLRLWVKHRNLFSDSVLADQFRTWRKQLLQLKKDLIRPEFTTVLPVLTPETTVLQETARLLTELTALQLTPQHLVINRILPPSSCPQCQTIAHRHQHSLNQAQAQFPQTLMPVPFLPTLPVGCAGLVIYGSYLMPE